MPLSLSLSPISAPLSTTLYMSFSLDSCLPHQRMMMKNHPFQHLNMSQSTRRVVGAESLQASRKGVSFLGKAHLEVYEGISSEGIFFALREVSALELGIRGEQSIHYLDQEIEILSQFEHENIVRYLGTVKVDSKLYIFLELVTQGSLANTYQRHCVHDAQASAYAKQILMGLKYLQDRNVVHRDIRCANILIASNEMVKLADFGLAKVTGLMDLKSCKGSAFWMAPEVIYNKNQGHGLAANIWCLGCNVLEMLTGHVPYYPCKFTQALLKMVRGQLPPVPDSLSSDARDFLFKNVCV